MKLTKSEYSVLDHGWHDDNTYRIIIGTDDVNFLAIFMSKRTNFRVRYADTRRLLSHPTVKEPDYETLEHTSKTMNPREFQNFIEQENRFKHLETELWGIIITAVMDKPKKVAKILAQLGIAA